MSRVAVGVLLLSVFLAWRGADSAWVALTDRDATRDALAGLLDDDRARLARSLADLTPAGAPADALLLRYELLARELPPRALVYLLHPFTGPDGGRELAIWMRLSALLAPRVLQPVSSVPDPRPGRQDPSIGRSVFLLDLRAGAAGVGPEPGAKGDGGAGRGGRPDAPGGPATTPGSYPASGWVPLGQAPGVRLYRSASP